MEQRRAMRTPGRRRNWLRDQDDLAEHGPRLGELQGFGRPGQWEPGGDLGGQHAIGE